MTTPQARRERAARVLDEWSTKTHQFPSHVVGISHVEMREWERLIDMITTFAAQEAEQVRAEEREQIDRLISEWEAAHCRCSCHTALTSRDQEIDWRGSNPFEEEDGE